MKETMVAYLFVMLSACAMIAPNERPKTLAESIEVAELQVTAAYNTVTGMILNKSISREAGKQVINTIDSVDSSLELATAANIKGDISTATGQLEAAKAALLLVNKRIAELEKDNGK